VLDDDDLEELEAVGFRFNESGLVSDARLEIQVVRAGRLAGVVDRGSFHCNSLLRIRAQIYLTERREATKPKFDRKKRGRVPQNHVLTLQLYFFARNNMDTTDGVAVPSPSPTPEPQLSPNRVADNVEPLCLLPSATLELVQQVEAKLHGEGLLSPNPKNPLMLGAVSPQSPGATPTVVKGSGALFPPIWSAAQQAVPMGSPNKESTPTEWSVVLPVGVGGLLMSARETEEGGPILVTGFRRDKDGQIKGPAELSTQVQPGNCITHINGVQICGLKHLKELLSGAETARLTLRDSTLLERRKIHAPSEAASPAAMVALKSPHTMLAATPKTTPGETAVGKVDAIDVLPFRNDWMWTVKLPVGEDGLLINANEVKENHIQVRGFRTAKNQTLGAAQLSKKIRQGDFITHLGRVKLAGLSHLVKLLGMQRGKKVLLSLHASRGQPFPRNVSLLASSFKVHSELLSPSVGSNKKRKRLVSSVAGPLQESNPNEDVDRDTPKKARKSPKQEMVVAGFGWDKMLDQLANTPKKIKELVRRRLSGSAEKVISFAQARSLFPDVDDLNAEANAKLEAEIDRFFWDPTS
jgi:hypothetical protein